MAGTSITITDTATPVVNRLIAVATQPAAMMRDIAGYLLFSTQRRFETETGPDGKKWPPLKPRTAAARAGRKVRGTDHILRDTTRLYQSLISASDATSAQVGTNVEYAAIHQFGGAIAMPARAGRVTFKKIRGKRGVRFVRTGTKDATVQDVAIGAHAINMPARPFLGINADDQAEIETIAAEALRREADL
jgi:phage virion morphogenesis protein